MSIRVRMTLYFFIVLAVVPLFAKDKKKQVLPNYVLKAQTVAVVIRPEAGEPLTSPTANRTALGRPSGRAPNISNEAGMSEDSFEVYIGGVDYPLDAPPVWRYMAKDALNRLDDLSQQFRNAVNESDQLSQQKP